MGVTPISPTDHRLAGHSSVAAEAAQAAFENGFVHCSSMARKVGEAIRFHTSRVMEHPHIGEVDPSDFGVTEDCWSIDLTAFIPQPSDQVEAASELVSQLECLLAAAKQVEEELRTPPVEKVSPEGEVDQ